MPQRDDFEARLVELARRDSAFRARLVADPRAAIAEALSVDLPAGLVVRVVEERPGEAVLVLPVPAPANELAEHELAAVAGGTGGSWCGHTYCGRCDSLYRCPPS